MKKTLPLLTVWISVLSPLLAQTLTPDQIKVDLRIFRESLETFHPELYHYISKEDFQKQLQSVEATAHSTIDQRNFYRMMLPVLASVKDGHLKWIVRGQDQYYPFFQENLFPLMVHVNKENVQIIKHFSGEKIPELAALKSINGIPIQEVIQSLLENSTFGDGYSEGGKYYQVNRYFSAFYSTEFGVDENYILELEINGQPVIWKGKGVSRQTIESHFPPQKEPFSFKLVEGNVAIMKINRFYTFKGEPDFKKFLRESFELIREKEIRRLILDLRGNEGGNEKYGIELYKYLALEDFNYYDKVTSRPNQKVNFETHTSKIYKLANSLSKNEEGESIFRFVPTKVMKPFDSAFKGKLLILTDGQSFSVTTEFSARVKADGRGVFIGEETAGGAELNSSGFFTIVTLPHSKIDLGIPRLGFHIANLSPNIDPRRGILPDIILSPDAEDKLSGKDPVLEKALDMK